MIIGNWTHSQVCSIMLVKTTQYKSSGISSANLLRALEIFDLPPAISPKLNKCPGSNPVITSNSVPTNMKFARVRPLFKGTVDLTLATTGRLTY